MKISAELLSKCIWKPAKLGITGYVLFLFVIVVTKYFAYIIGNLDSVSVEKEDFVISLIGFILFFLIRLIENFQKNQHQLR